MGKVMADVHDNPEESALFFATQGGHCVDAIWGILDRSRKYVAEVRPMFMRGNIPAFISFARDKHCLSGLAREACFVVFFEAKAWLQAFSADKQGATDAVSIIKQTLESADLAIVAFALTDARTMMVKSCRYDCQKPTIPNEA